MKEKLLFYRNCTGGKTWLQLVDLTGDVSGDTPCDDICWLTGSGGPFCHNYCVRWCWLVHRCAWGCGSLSCLFWSWMNVDCFASVIWRTPIWWRRMSRPCRYFLLNHRFLFPCPGCAHATLSMVLVGSVYYFLPLWVSASLFMDCPWSSARLILLDKFVLYFLAFSSSAKDLISALIVVLNESNAKYDSSLVYRHLMWVFFIMCTYLSISP